MVLERSYPIQSQQTEIVYSESDGLPMAENTKQYDWITLIKGNIDIIFAADPNVFVAGDLFWYPVEGHPEIRQAPDVMVVFGRPKGHRISCLQWREENIAPQVVFEILSPGNTVVEMNRKFRFYEQYGVEEYYLYDPDTGDLQGWRRLVTHLISILEMDGWVSPRLGVRFALSADGLVLYQPDGDLFLGFVELAELAGQAEELAERARARAEQAESRAARLAARLPKLGVDPDANGTA